MKLVTFVDQGAIKGGRVDDGDVRAFRLGSRTFRLEEWLDSGNALADLETDSPISVGTLTLLPPILCPRKILCVGANFEEHRREMGRPRPEHPMIFTRFAETLVGHRGCLVRPRASGAYDYEGELCCVIGRTARHLTPDNALEAVAGFSIFNDGTARDWQKHTSQFTPGKNFDRTAGFGPWMVTRDEINDLDTLVLQTRVNGEVRQQAQLSDLTFSVVDLLVYISTFTTLMPGDLVVCGTPSGVGASFDPPRFLSAGDLVEISISGIGTLVNEVVAEA
ncbi:MAG: fumarylacetoacetate hydrolase family protein [Myxococcota bacterium]